MPGEYVNQTFLISCPEYFDPIKYFNPPLDATFLQKG